MTEFDVFEAAIAILDAAERTRFLNQQCAGKLELQQRLEQLIEAHLHSQPLLDQASDIFPTAGWQAQSASHQPPGDLGRRRDEMPPTIETASLNSGSMIAGRYQLREQVGEGGMGEVWVAEQKVPVKRKVAVKLIKPGMDSRSVLARFEAERQALAVMDHPNIAKVFDGGMTPQGRPFFVMELVKGIPLTDYCDQVQFTVRQRLELFTQVCSAVQHAHQKGIIHRDLKPSNILVTEHDGKPMCKVIDFGLAKALQGSLTLTDMSLHTAFGTVVGTPLYMAPEQLGVSALDVDTRSDLYSLGVILYELLTGSTPIERQRLKDAVWDEIRRIVRDEEPPRPSQRISSSDTLPGIAARRHVEPARLTNLVRGELDWIIMKALEKDRNRRYESANGLSMDIQRYLVGEAVLAAPPSRVYRVRKFVRRNRGPVIAASLLSLSLVGGMAGTTYGLFRANQAAQAEQIAKLDAQTKQREAEAQEAEATKQQARAEQREQEAIDSVKRFGDSVSNNPELKNNPSLESLRKTLLQEPLSFFQSLRSRLQSDPDTRPESLARLATAARDLGFLTEEIGDKQNAIEAFRQSIDILQKLVEANPTVTGFQHELARCHTQIGVLLAETGESTQAQAAHEKAIEIRERLVQANPTITEFQSGLADSCSNIGYLFETTGELAKALAAYEKSLEIDERLVQAHPTTTEFQNNLSKSHTIIGELFRSTGESVKALAAFEKALEIGKRLVQSNPDVTEFQNNLAGNHNNIGVVFYQTGEPAKAQEALEKAIEIWEQLVEAHPTVTKYQSDLAASHNAIGLLFRATGDLAKAAEAHEKAIEIRERLVQAHPTVTEFRSRLANSYHNIGLLFATTGEPAKTLAAGNKALEIRERLVQANPTVTEFQSQLASSHNYIGVQLSETGEADNALAAHENALEIWERLVQANPTVSEFQIGLAASHNAIGLLLSRTGEPAKALAATEKAIEIQERLVQANPSITKFQSGLAASHTSIGLLLAAIGEPAKALAAHEKALEIRERLVQANPTIINNKCDLGATLNNIAMVENGLARFASAQTHLLEAIEWQKQAVAANPTSQLCRQFLRNHYTNLLITADGLSDNKLRLEARRGMAELVANDPASQKIDGRIEEVVAGAETSSVEELLALAQRGYDTQRFELAARFLNQALEAEPSLAESRQTQHAYNAACAAALAGCEDGVDDPPSNEEAKTNLRTQAFHWLEFELESWKQYLDNASAEQRPIVVQTLQHWQFDPDLSGVRGDAIDKLPESERAGWISLWQSVADLVALTKSGSEQSQKNENGE